MEGSPSIRNSEPSSDFGSASGASVSNKILSEGTYKRNWNHQNFLHLPKSKFKAI